MSTSARSMVKSLSLGLGALLVLVVGCSDDAAAPDRSVPPLLQGGTAGSGGRVSGAGRAGASGTPSGGKAGSGAADPGGAAGSGEAGADGEAGEGGSSGDAGATAAGGESGAAGKAGSGGKGGAAGSAGKGGAAGGAGKGGAAGTGGSAGEAGSAGASGGSGGAGGQSTVLCDRAAATKTAPLSLLTTLEAALAAAATPDDKTKLVEAFLDDVKAQGGTPLVADAPSEDVAFVIRGAPFQGTFHVAGGFNAWSESALPMKAIAGTDLYVATAKIARGTSQPYKLVDVPDGKAGVYFEDRLARHVVWDGFDNHDVGEVNALVRAEAGDLARGRLEAYRDVPTKALANTRDVFVYVPPTYDAASCPALPVLVVHDGNESITRSPFHLAADDHFVAHPSDAAVLVFVALHAQTERIDDYTFATPSGRADAYGDALRDEILPWAAQTHRLCPGARDRGLTGASLGGLVSTYIGLRDPGTWGYIGAQSPSYWWEDKAIFPIASAKPVAKTRIYVDNGCAANGGADQDGCANAAAFVKLLDEKGWDVTHVVEPGGQHDWAFWQKRWPQMLARFREGRVGCE